MNFKLILLGLLISVSGFGAETESHYTELFEQANAAYKIGQYDSAKAIYAEISETGIVSSSLFYNLGNCYFKTGSVANAILNYERALRLSPDDEDVIYNLEIANSRITDKVDVIEPFFITQWWQNAALSLHPDSWAWISLVFILSLVAVLSLFILGRESSHKKLGFLGSIVMLILLGMSYSFGSTALNWKNRKEAIIFAPTVNVKSEPTNKSTDQFVLHEGVKVIVLAQDADWLRIRLSDGNSGWVPRQSTETI
ncbi:MAG: tetratricopeptide repeat protein [Salibacteraceae bacterium]|jgi:tetratricopeptide (TPR) repeat protein|nr:tetratricopeptide repeat protein [Salibacteraceae bacterium]